MKIRITHQDEVKHICDLTTKVCGLRKGSLSYKTRKQEVQIGRIIASNIARIEKGIHQITIAEALNRNRCSVYHYEKTHKELYPNWAKYRNAFNKVYSAYTNQKKNVLPEEVLLRILKAEGVKSFAVASTKKLRNLKRVTPYNVIITIDLGKSSIKVLSNYQTFTETIEKLKSILEGYTHELSVNL